MLLKKIKDDQLQARKDRDTQKANLLTTLYSEAAMVGKNKGNRDSTDEEVIAVIKKFHKDNGAVLDSMDGSVSDTVKFAWERERQILASYLPKQMTEDEIKAAITAYKNFADENPNMGGAMKFLKENYSGQYDGKMASSIAKEMLG